MCWGAKFFPNQAFFSCAQNFSLPGTAGPVATADIDDDGLDDAIFGAPGNTDAGGDAGAPGKGGELDYRRKSSG